MEMKQIYHSSFFMINLLSQNWIYFCSFLFFIQFFFYFFNFFKTKKRKKFFDFFVFSKNFSKENFLLIFDISLFGKTISLVIWFFNVIYHIFLFLEKKGFILFFSKFLSFTINRQDGDFGWKIFSKNKTAGKIFVFGWKTLNSGWKISYPYWKIFI